MPPQPVPSRPHWQAQPEQQLLPSPGHGGALQVGPKSEPTRGYTPPAGRAPQAPNIRVTDSDICASPGLRPPPSVTGDPFNLPRPPRASRVRVCPSQAASPTTHEGAGTFRVARQTVTVPATQIIMILSATRMSVPVRLKGLTEPSQSIRASLKARAPAREAAWICAAVTASRGDEPHHAKVPVVTQDMPSAWSSSSLRHGIH